MKMLVHVALLLGTVASPIAVHAAIEATSASYTLGINDEVQVSVFGGHPIDVKTRVKENGGITLPMLGEVQAAGQTANQLASNIAQKLKAGSYYVNPIVNVEITSFVSNSVTAFGSLQQPGLYPIDRPLTVAMVLARAGGTRNDAADYVILRRKGQPDRRVILDELANGSDEPLIAGDSIFVPAAPLLYVYGQVNKPGKIEIRSGMTLRQAIAEAGGPTLAGTQKRITLTRGPTTQKKVPLDTPVQAGDVYFVNEKLF
ncbi:MAG: polysaccharide biosynthesis/export family protein [Sphingobium sp.]|uniref:polysaccharide biosynthesis/export family protein n=1 Tax=Sphingobium sp. TaxID=1912891 RepID=UPI0029AA31A6|nr:polysaccharide biosynthesis/export family protein [Sphingobium sp.]MDX3908907.1 polysaccharide biosynthesis/export family protein [Sphingobium sp.]